MLFRGDRRVGLESKSQSRSPRRRTGRPCGTATSRWRLSCRGSARNMCSRCSSGEIVGRVVKGKKKVAGKHYPQWPACISNNSVTLEKEIGSNFFFLVNFGKYTLARGIQIDAVRRSFFGIVFNSSSVVELAYPKNHFCVQLVFAFAVQRNAPTALSLPTQGSQCFPPVGGASFLRL